MFFEYCNQGTIRKLLQLYKALSIQDSLYVIAQVVEGFKEVHEKQVIHRDIKPENIFLSDYTIKIGDFGFARIL